MYKKYIERMDFVAHKKDVEEILEMLMCEVEESNVELYEHIKCRMYEIVYGKKINEEKAMEWVRSMQPVGQHWTMEETTNAMQKMGYTCDKIEYYVVANMMYNDYYDLVKEDETMALKFAYSWLKDKDSVEHKLYEYWKHIVMK
nr:hypothetical protein [Clostridia bacterium]